MLMVVRVRRLTTHAQTDPGNRLVSAYERLPMSTTSWTVRFPKKPAKLIERHHFPSVKPSFPYQKILPPAPPLKTRAPS